VATIIRDFRVAEGYGTHPDASTAVEMALLEAAQTLASSAAGGREDLSIQARSLGRHERPRPSCARDIWEWLDPDAIEAPLSQVVGFSSTDVYEDLTWCLARIRGAGVEHVLMTDLSRPEAEPAAVVRVIIPGLETNNPFYTGPRARQLLLRDLLPRWA
jgi:ribosomal protein S12 methylthiotransferase accessory factor